MHLYFSKTPHTGWTQKAQEQVWRQINENISFFWNIQNIQNIHHIQKRTQPHRSTFGKRWATLSCCGGGKLLVVWQPITVVSIDLIWASFISFSDNRVYWDNLVLSIYDVIVSQKTVQWKIKVAYLWVGQRISLPLFSSLRSENKAGANTFWVNPLQSTVI